MNESTNKRLENQRRTKIVATLGPASRSPEMVRALILAGANVFRLNFSHDTPEHHLQTLQTVRSVAAELQAPIAVLQDLSGPKIRISNIAGNFATVPDHSQVELRFAGHSESAPLSSECCIYVEALNPLEFLQVGQRVLLADGIMEFKVVEICSDAIKCIALKGGRLRSRVGIAFPDSHVNLPATTEKDLQDFIWGIQQQVDFVAVSFVQSAEDILKLRVLALQNNSAVQLIAKIERRLALNNIDQILDVADGMMVARGDLGLELPLEQVPIVQQELIKKANQRGLPAIVATQMLQSMVTSIRPTRAEATDVAFAVFNGADAVMLSEETTIGEHPIECVQYLDRIACAAEASLLDRKPDLDVRYQDEMGVPDAIAFATCAAARKIGAQAIVACTASGNSARLVAKYRPMQPILGVSSNEAALRRLALYWGVTPIQSVAPMSNLDQVEVALAAVKAKICFSRPATVVMTVGNSFRTPGSTNQLEIRSF